MDPRVDMRRYHVTSQDTVWIGWPNRYRVELWHPFEGRIDVIDRPVSWFEPWQDYGNPFEEEPGPSISSIYRDPEDRLWVSILLPTYWTPVELPADGRLPTIGELSRRYRTKVEVLDVADLRVLADTVIEGFPFEWTPTGEAFRVVEDELGFERLQVWRPELRYAADSSDR